MVLETINLEMIKVWFLDLDKSQRLLLFKNYMGVLYTYIHTPNYTFVSSKIHDKKGHKSYKLWGALKSKRNHGNRVETLIPPFSVGCLYDMQK